MSFLPLQNTDLTGDDIVAACLLGATVPNSDELPVVGIVINSKVPCIPEGDPIIIIPRILSERTPQFISVVA